MQSKEILYDEIYTDYKGMKFYHGKVTYEELDMTGRDPNLSQIVKANVNLNLALFEEQSNEFIQELTALIQKYSV